MDPTTAELLLKLGGGGLASCLLYLIYLIGMRLWSAVDGLRIVVGEMRDDVRDLRSRVDVALELAPAPAESPPPRRAPTNPAGVPIVDRPWDKRRS